MHGLYSCQKIDEGFPECDGEIEFHGYLRVTTDIIGSKPESIRAKPLLPFLRYGTVLILSKLRQTKGGFRARFPPGSF